MIKNIQTLIAVCVLSAASASATSVTIGEPNTSVCYPFSCNDGASTGLSIHYQQVFASGLFPTAAISIHNISFGIDGFTGLITGQGGTVLNGNYQIAFSTTKAAVGGLTANLNDNQGLDQTVFYNNSTISGFTAASGSPLTIGGSSFIYNPLAGNLLMDIIVTNQAFLSSADAGSFDGSASYDSNGLYLPFNTSSVFMIGNQSVVTGAFGLVTTFDFSTVNAAVTTPEIGSMLMVGFGVAILLYAKRRSSDFARVFARDCAKSSGVVTGAAPSSSDRVERSRIWPASICRGAGCSPRARCMPLPFRVRTSSTSSIRSPESRRASDTRFKG